MLCSVRSDVEQAVLSLGGDSIPVFIVGHSQGGAVGLLLAASFAYNSEFKDNIAGG